MKDSAVASGDEERIKQIDTLLQRVENNQHLYKKISKDQIRKIFYNDGVDITYYKLNKSTGELVPEIIHYRMLYRNPSKAKQGSVMFIRDELYDIAYDWLTMGIGRRLPQHNAKIVEISAYAPLSTSSIEGTIQVPVNDVLILND